MARPTKQGLDYFSLDVNPDSKVQLIEAKYGLSGYAVIIKLWQLIYSEGYYYYWGEEQQLLFCKNNNADINLVSDIINDSLRWKIFDNCMYKQYSVLTSTGIQKRYFTAIDKRVGTEIVKSYVLVEIPEKVLKNAVVITEETELMSEETPLIPEESTQSKVKESKALNNIVHLENSSKDADTVKAEKEDLDAEFDLLWSKYPNKKGKRDALRFYKRERKQYSYEELNGSLDIYIAECNKKRKGDKNWKESFIMHGSTFFNGKFEDYLKTEKTKSTVQSFKPIIKEKQM